jgi:hypothetical protein
MGFELSAMAINPYALKLLTTYNLLKLIYEDLSQRFSRKKAKLKQQRDWSSFCVNSKNH